MAEMAGQLRDVKVLITGTPGWLGTRLMESLLTAGRRIRCLVQPGGVASSLEESGAEIARGDITDPRSLDAACAGIGTVFHCAGMIHPKRVRQFYEVNTEGTANLAEAAIRAGVRRFIYVSSNSAGIDGRRLGIAREADPDIPFMHYGLSKLRAERILEGHVRRKALEAVIIRPNWLYGIKGPPRQARFLRMARRGAIYFGDGRSEHSLCDIDNCVQALMLAEISERALGQKYYIADARPYTILEIYSTIAAILDIEIVPRRMLALRQGSLPFEILNRLMQGLRFHLPEVHVAWEWSKSVVCSIDSARTELGYEPRVGLRAGLERAIAWHRGHGYEI